MSLNELPAVDPYRRSQLNRPEQIENSFSFDDFLDVVNPLQHIPVVSWIYREISGDKIGAPASIAGGALFGGPLGFAGAVMAAAYESLSGETPETTISRALSPAGRTRGIAAYGRVAALAES